MVKIPVSLQPPTKPPTVQQMRELREPPKTEMVDQEFQARYQKELEEYQTQLSQHQESITDVRTALEKAQAELDLMHRQFQAETQIKGAKFITKYLSIESGKQKEITVLRDMLGKLQQGFLIKSQEAIGYAKAVGETTREVAFREEAVLKPAREPQMIVRMQEIPRTVITREGTFAEYRTGERIKISEERIPITYRAIPIEAPEIATLPTEKPKEWRKIAATVSDVWRGGFFYGLYTTPRTYPRKVTYRRLAEALPSVTFGIGGPMGKLPYTITSEVMLMRKTAEERMELVEEQKEGLDEATRRIDKAQKDIEKWDEFVEEGEFIGTEKQYKEYEKDYLKFESIYQIEMAKLENLGLTTQETKEGIIFSTADVPMTMAREVALKGSRGEQIAAGAVIFTGKAAEWFVIGTAMIGVSGIVAPTIARLTAVPVAGKIITGGIVTAKFGLGGLIGARAGIRLVEEHKIAGAPGMAIVGAEYAGMAVGLGLAYDVPAKTAKWLKDRRTWSKKGMARIAQKLTSREKLEAYKKFLEQKEALKAELERKYMAGGKPAAEKEVLRILKQLKTSTSRLEFSKIIEDLYRKGLIRGYVFNTETGGIQFMEDFAPSGRIPKMQVGMEKLEFGMKGMGAMEGRIPAEALATKVKLGEEFILGTIIKSKEAVKEKEEFAIISKVKLRPKEKEKERVVEAAAPAIASALLTGQALVQPQVEVSALIQPQVEVAKLAEPTIPGFGELGRPGRPGPLKPPVPPVPIIIPSFRFPGERFRKATRTGYHAFAKSKGKWEKVTTKPHTREGAKDSFARVVDYTLSAQGKIEPIKQTKVVKGKQQLILKRFREDELEKGDDYFKRFAHKFRSFMIRRGEKLEMQNKWIEKKQHRSDLKSERQGLSVAAFVARERKRRAGLPVRRTKRRKPSKNIKGFFGVR